MRLFALNSVKLVTRDMMALFPVCMKSVACTHMHTSLAFTKISNCTFRLFRFFIFGDNDDKSQEKESLKSSFFSTEMKVALKTYFREVVAMINDDDKPVNHFSNTKYSFAIIKMETLYTHS